MLSALALGAAPPPVPADQAWAEYGRTSAQQRFSPAAEIDMATVKRLGLAWYHEFDTDRGQEATPIVAGGSSRVTARK